MLDNIKKYNVILASNSPRRKELLAGLGIDFKVKVIDGIDESYPPSLAAQQVAEYIAEKKAEAYRSVMDDNDLIITADTVVIVNNEILGKPTDAADAIRMLQSMAGRSHHVVTGVCITSKHVHKSFSVTTEVEFAALSDDEIDYYVERYRPFDKAGAYGIQEWIGYIGVTSLSGSYYNVMGLPVQRIYTELKRL
ncbi:MAG: Maf-like protein [Prevotellaceae bacterium]|nr:Maf-like protein [Prevotellaceae bacterium]